MPDLEGESRPTVVIWAADCSGTVDLGRLAGPQTGRWLVPSRLAHRQCAGAVPCDLARSDCKVALYERCLTIGSAHDIYRWVNLDDLIDLWPCLTLPTGLWAEWTGALRSVARFRHLSSERRLYPQEQTPVCSPERTPSPESTFYGAPKADREPAYLLASDRGHEDRILVFGGGRAPAWGRRRKARKCSRRAWPPDRHCGGERCGMAESCAALQVPGDPITMAWPVPCRGVEAASIPECHTGGVRIRTADRPTGSGR